MNLPVLRMPTFEVVIPSTKFKSKIRPMTAKEEKILLIAKESADDKDILAAVKQIVGNCLLDIKIDDLTLFDLEYLYLKIWAVSESNKIKLSYRDSEDNKVRDFEIDLDKVNVTFPEKDLSVVDLGNNVSMRLKYPSTKLYDDKEFLSLTGETVFEELAARCLDTVHEGEKSFSTKTMKLEEIKKWMDTIPMTAYDQIKEFFRTSPSLRHEITYTNDNNKERKITLSTLNDFFTLR